MAMNITYEIRDALYINITNRCTNHCVFCVRSRQDGLMPGASLWLKREPSVAEVLAAIEKRDMSRYREVVFCGYGEPLSRVYDIIEICKKLKAQYPLPIRINTNGQANLLYGKDITPLLAGYVDYISVSLNAKDAYSYQAMCRSEYGEAAFSGLLAFAERCKKHIPHVALSVVDVLPAEDIERCREIAGKIGVDFRVRHFVG